MKCINTIVFYKISNHLPFEEAERVTEAVLEFGLEGLDQLRYDVKDHMQDYFPEEKAQRIADEVIIAVQE
jgi:hypothetical protein